MNPHPYVIATDGQQFPFFSNGQEWLVSWHPPGDPPDGTRHGSEGICLTPDGYVILISQNGTDWLFPGGRPEPGEDWHETLVREMWEEACAQVRAATLLGFNRGRCVRGHEEGLVLVRATWRVEVDLAAWQPEFEIPFRALVRPAVALGLLNRHYPRAIQRRWLRDALNFEPAGDWTNTC